MCGNFQGQKYCMWLVGSVNRDQLLQTVWAIRQKQPHFKAVLISGLTTFRVQSFTHPNSASAPRRVKDPLTSVFQKISAIALE